MFSCGCYFVSVASLSTPNSACDDDEIRSTKFDTYWYRDHHWGWVWKDLHFFIYKHTLHNAMPHHTTPHHTTPHHTTSHHITPHHTTPHHITPQPHHSHQPHHATQHNAIFQAHVVINTTLATKISSRFYVVNFWIWNIIFLQKTQFQRPWILAAA